jgi:hypothetical protein
MILAGVSLSPQEWRQMLDNERHRVLVDVRNDYEWQIGMQGYGEGWVALISFCSVSLVQQQQQQQFSFVYFIFLVT